MTIRILVASQAATREASQGPTDMTEHPSGCRDALNLSAAVSGHREAYS